MPTGTVKWFSLAKRYGFITEDTNGLDVFVHISSVERAGLHSLRAGQQIDYEIVLNRGRRCAENLRHSSHYTTSFEIYEEEQHPDGPSRRAARSPRNQLRPVRRDTETTREQQRHVEENIIKMRGWFTGVSAQLIELRPMIYETKGTLFKRHKHSISDVLSQPIFRKISSMLGTIEDNIRRWQTYGPLDYLLIGAYEDEKRRIVEQIDDLQVELIQRKPTFWEVIRDSLKAIIPKSLLRLGSSSILRIGRDK